MYICFSSTCSALKAGKSLLRMGKYHKNDLLQISQCILWGNWFGSSTKPIDFLRHTLCASQHQYTPVFLHNRVIPVPQSQGLPHRTLTGKNIKIDFLHFLWYAAYPETLQRHPTVVLICFQWNAQGSSVAAGSGLSISLPFLTPAYLSPMIPDLLFPEQGQGWCIVPWQEKLRRAEVL